MTPEIFRLLRQLPRYLLRPEYRSLKTNLWLRVGQVGPTAKGALSVLSPHRFR